MSEGDADAVWGEETTAFNIADVIAEDLTWESWKRRALGYKGSDVRGCKVRDRTLCVIR